MKDWRYLTGKVTVKSRSKYGAKKVKADGITFDSKAEYARYLQLKLLEKAGKITHLSVHRRFTLQDSFPRNGRMIRAIVYEADFFYRENGKLVAEDVKAVRTPVFLIKQKLFLLKYPNVDLRIIDVKG